MGMGLRGQSESGRLKSKRRKSVNLETDRPGFGEGGSQEEGDLATQTKKGYAAGAAAHAGAACDDGGSRAAPDGRGN